MSAPFIIHLRILSEMHFFLDNEKHHNRSASADDMDFIKEGDWLKDAAVIDVIVHQRGGWNVYLVFAHHKKPLQLIVRNITRCYSLHKAKLSAFYIKKEAAKDRRGNLQTSITDLNICDN